MSRVAIIPARGGSKRIPRKNVKNFCGKPMICWSIETLLACNCFDKVVVSTDNKEIALIARECGAEVPFIRPANLSDDHTGTIPVIKNAISWLEENWSRVDYACCVYATAPFLDKNDVQNGWLKILSKEFDYVFSVTTFPYPIQRALRLSSTFRVEMVNEGHFLSRSQDLEEVWHDAGQFYWGTRDAWLNERSFFTNRSSVIKIDRQHVQDIDTDEDWLVAEKLFKLSNRSII